MLNLAKALDVERANFVPERIIARGSEKQVLAEWSRRPYKNNLLIVSHESGTGKSVSVKWFFKNSLSDFVKVYVLCRDTQTEHETFKAVSQIIESQTNIPIKNTKSHHDLVKYFKSVLESGKKIVVCLDEIDYLIEMQGNDNLLNSLLHIQRETKKGELLFILISNDYFIRRKLSYITTSRLNEIIVPFDKYAVSDGVKILKYYIKDFGLLENAGVPNDAELTRILTLFVRKLAMGDMRRILNSFILWATRCNDKLDLDKLDDDFFEEVTKTEVMRIIENLIEEEKTIILSLIKSEIDCKDFEERRGRGFPEKFYETKFERFYKYYMALSDKVKIPPLKKRRFRFYLREIIEKKHLICIYRVSFGRGKGMAGVYDIEEVMKEYFETVVEKLCKDLGIPAEYIFNLNESRIMV